MAARRKASSVGRAHKFGGDWTEAKLNTLRKYLSAYTTALQYKPRPESRFTKVYIDAFAGTGYRTSVLSDPTGAAELPFPDLAEAAPQALLDGSARIALKASPEFEQYVFIERHAGRCAELHNLKTEFPTLAPRIVVKQGEANAQIQALCRTTNWHSHRAVMFLDPYGMQVDWQTVEAVAKTHAIDLWLLVPLGIGMNRILTRSGDIPSEWRTALDRFLGTPDWYDAFYAVDQDQLLLGFDDEPRRVKASMEVMAKFFVDRLRTIFPGVAEPGVLRNSANCPLYLFCFAAGNERGKDPALRIANHILKEIR